MLPDVSTAMRMSAGCSCACASDERPAHAPPTPPLPVEPATPPPIPPPDPPPPGPPAPIAVAPDPPLPPDPPPPCEVFVFGPAEHATETATATGSKPAARKQACRRRMA